MKYILYMTIILCTIIFISCKSISLNNSENVELITDFESDYSLTYYPSEAETHIVKNSKGSALQVDFQDVQNPKVLFDFDQPQNWTDKMLLIDFTNPTTENVKFNIRIDSDESPDGLINTLTYQINLAANSSETFMLSFRPENTNHGMKDFGNIIESAWGGGVDISHIIGFQFWQWNPYKQNSIIIDNIILKDHKQNGSITNGLVDKFGQLTKTEWKGKINSISELRSSSKRESKTLLTPGEIEGRSIYGGWLNEEKRVTGSGYFRTEKIDGKWWLIDPLGYLYFSTGMDIIRTPDMNTMITSREKMFTWLPRASEKLGKHYDYADYVFSGAVDKGDVYNFYTANLERKYGSNWYEKWKEIALKRTVTWGFTSFGNWSDPSFWGNGNKNKVPYVADGWVTGDHSTLSSGNDYWGEMHNPFDPLFRKNVALMANEIALKVKNDPWCMGIFVDNEMSWGSNNSDKEHYGIILSAFKYHVSLNPAKKMIMDYLKNKYISIEDLNRSWKTEFNDWSRIEETFSPLYYINDNIREDLSAILELFAEEYYKIVQEELKKVLPNHLYLGSRMPDWSKPDEVVKACSKYTDVVSFNFYKDGIRPEEWEILKTIDKPAIIGEFHFGAKDSGMLSAGLVPVASQEARGEMYSKYLKSVLANPYFVGAHWFQYVDEPLTGRAWDGENYNIGFVAVTDEPYKDLVDSAKETNFNVYNLR